MADIDKPGGDCPNSDDDFRDPLGANGPIIDTLESITDEIDLEINAFKSCELDAVLAKNSTRVANLHIDEDENETKDLFVIIDNPEKHTTTMESYITFRVTSKTTRSEYDNSEFQVRRRYNDFLWIRQRLEESQTTHLIPPLPEKHSLQRLDRFSQEFVKTREQALQKFVSRIADHPVLSFNKNFQTFLTAKQWEFQAAKKEGSGFMTRMADSFHNMSASYMMKNRPPEFTVMNEYINMFSEKLGTIDRISKRIHKEQYEHLVELNDWGPIFTLWSNSEDRLSPALGAVAKAVEKNYSALQDLVDGGESYLSHPLREYQLYAECVKAVLRRRDAIQVEYEMTHEELNKKKDEKDQQQIEEVRISEQSYSIGTMFGKSQDAVKEEKINKIESAITELGKQMELLNDKSVCANADLKADMERWNRNKRKDFRKLFTDLADRQIKFYQKCLEAWEEAIPIIQRTDVLHAEPETVLQSSTDS